MNRSRRNRIKKRPHKIKKETIEEIKSFYPKMMELFAEDMAKYDNNTSQTLRIREDTNSIMFVDNETLESKLEEYS